MLSTIRNISVNNNLTFLLSCFHVMWYTCDFMCLYICIIQRRSVIVRMLMCSFEYGGIGNLCQSLSLTVFFIFWNIFSKSNQNSFTLSGSWALHILFLSQISRTGLTCCPLPPCAWNLCWSLDLNSSTYGFW